MVKIFRPMPVKDSDGNLIGRTEKVYATYTYDAWGKLIGITDSNGDSLMNKQATSSVLANRNPLRYRGYYYDVETGFYYLQSRYYDPTNHRFINADVYTSTDSSDAVSCNMFAYCGNNPVTGSDENGESWFSSLVEATVGGVVNAVCTAVTGGSAGDVAKSFATGFVDTLASNLIPFYGTVKRVVSTVDTIVKCRRAGASWGESLVAGGATLVASFVGADESQRAAVKCAVNLTFGLGASLTAKATETAIINKHTRERRKNQTSNSIAERMRRRTAAKGAVAMLA